MTDCILFIIYQLIKINVGSLSITIIIIITFFSLSVFADSLEVMETSGTSLLQSVVPTEPIFHLTLPVASASYSSCPNSRISFE